MSANYANLANEVVFVLRQSHLCYGHTMATSLHWPLSSVPKVAVVERFNCSYCISSITLLFFFLQSVKGVNRNQWGRYPPHQVLFFGFLYQIYIVKCFVILNEVCAPAFGHLNTVTSLCELSSIQHLCKMDPFLTATSLFFSHFYYTIFSLYNILVAVDILLKQANPVLGKVDCLYIK